MPLVIDWRNASQPADVVTSVVAVLRQGGLAVLPTESGYLVAAGAAFPNAVDRLLSGPAGASGSLEMLVSGPGDVERWTGPLPHDVERIVGRLWPGPLRLAVPVSDEVSAEGSPTGRWVSGGRLNFRSPGHTAAEGVVQAADFPLIAREVGHAAGSEETAAALAQQWGEAVAVVVDAGPVPTRAVTVLTVEDGGWRIEMEGEIGRDTVVAAAAAWVVFVCTGNTCRSPMTEALCKNLLAARLGCAVDELPARGFLIISAGVSAYPGDGPTPEAVDVLRELGADLSAHRSRPLAPEVVAHADHLIAMTRGHLLAVLSRYPVIGGTMRLLGGAEGDLDDPIGGGPEVYAACARTILRRLDRLLTELVRR
jgi:L-threonylcarbamoyladenylate synthase